MSIVWTKKSNEPFPEKWTEKPEIYLHTYQDFKEARSAVFEYFESWYNRRRIHSSIGYLTPQPMEDKKLKNSV